MIARTIALISLYSIILCAVVACQSSGDYYSLLRTGSTERKSSPWIYHGVSGQTIRTAHYRIHTTVEDVNLIADLPRFYEFAYPVYRNLVMLKGHSHDESEVSLESSSVMDVYVLNTRKEWEAFTHELLMERANALVRLNRGGFTTRGTSVYYDIGYHDSLTIAAHEGWHQFVQTHFVDPLPVWLDEGLACEMESLSYGFIDDKNQFQSKNNPQRKRQLIDARNNGRLLNLNDLLEGSPALYVNDDQSLSSADYYAQVWGLVRFLDEYHHGRYRKGLRKLLQDARSGEIAKRMGRGGSHPSGNQVFRFYFDDDIKQVNKSFIRFVNELE